MGQKAKDKMEKNCKLACPVCLRKTEYRADGRIPGQRVDAEFLPEPGTLTACGHCKALLEFTPGTRGLKLKRCSAVRAKLFTNFGCETMDRKRLPALLAYVKKYRRMPVNRPSGSLCQSDKGIELPGTLCSCRTVICQSER